MKHIAGLMVIIGLAVGFAYPMYLSARSGKNLGDVSLQERGRALSVGSIALDPGMNPLEIGLSAEVYHRRNEREQHIFAVSTRLGGKEIHRESVGLTAEEKDPANTRIVLSNTLSMKSVAVPGKYEFHVSTSGENYPVTNQTLSLRGNVEQPKTHIRNIGLGIFFAGCVLALL